MFNCSFIATMERPLRSHDGLTEKEIGCRIEASRRVWTEVQEGALQSSVWFEPYKECC